MVIFDEILPQLLICGLTPLETCEIKIDLSEASSKRRLKDKNELESE